MPIQLTDLGSGSIRLKRRFPFLQTNGLKLALLCSACKKLFSGEIGSTGRDQPHHESVASLYQGGELGCRICMLIWQRTSEKQRQYMRDQEADTFELSKSHHYWGHMTRDDVYKHFRVIVELFGDSPEVKKIRIDLALEPVKSREPT